MDERTATSELATGEPSPIHANHMRNQHSGAPMTKDWCMPVDIDIGRGRQGCAPVAWACPGGCCPRSTVHTPGACGLRRGLCFPTWPACDWPWEIPGPAAAALGSRQPACARSPGELASLRTPPWGCECGLRLSCFNMPMWAIASCMSA